MILDLSDVRIFVKPGPTDMRKQINGLSVLVEEQLEMDPFSGSLFLFCNRARRLIKIVYWDRTGFCLWVKRLEQDKFPWPANKKEACEISIEEFKLLLKGIDFWKAHKNLEYTSVL